MKKLSFFSVLKSNIKCALCRNKECSVRYMPQRNMTYGYNGTIYKESCKKDREKRERKILKKKIK